MKKIKILYIIDKMTRAGAQNHLLSVLKDINKERFDCQVYYLLEKGIAKIYNFQSIKKLFELATFMKKQRFDIVHTYLFSANIYGVIAAKLASIPIIITSRRDTGLLREGKWPHILAYKLTNRWVNKVVCVSNAVRNIVKKKEKLPDEKLITIYNGVDTVRSPGHHVTKSPVKKEFVVGMISNFSWIKGHKDFIEAAKLVLKEVPNAKFLLVGDGPLGSGLRCAVSGERLEDKLLFLGKRNDVPELLATMDVSVNASYSEGMSNTVLESMAAGVPVVVTAVDGNLETVEDAITGILVPPKNPSKMAEAIIKILKNKKLAEAMGNNARELVAKKFTSEIMVNNMQNLYIDLLKPKIAFIMSQFPETHETFILREMKALRDSGLKYKIFSLKPCKDKIIHEDAKPLMKEVDYSHLILSKGVFKANIFAFLKNPLKYLLVFGEILLKSIIPLGSFCKSLAVFPKSVYYAALINGQKINHIHSHWATIPSTSAYIASKFSGRSYSITAHAWDIFVKTPMLREKLKKAKFVVTCTKYNRSYLINELGLPENKVFLNYHGLEREWFEGKNGIASAPLGPRNDKGLGPRNDCHPFRTLAIGRLVEQKGFEYLINACSLLKDKGLDFECSIVGEGPLGNGLRCAVSGLRLADRVKLLGAKTQEEIKKLYSESDIFVAPSVVAKNGNRDGIPNVILEAMAMGLPVVGTDVSGLPEAIIDEKTGLLVSERDPEALAQAIEKLIGDKKVGQEFGKQGREFIKERFDLNKNVDSLIKTFDQNITAHPAFAKATAGRRTPLTAHRIKILYIIWSLEPGGAERVVTELAENIDKTKFEPYVCCINKPGTFSKELAERGIPVYYLDKKGRVDFGALGRLINLLRKHNFDVIHTHMFTSNLWGRLANIFAGNKPIVITEHNIDVWKRPLNYIIDSILLHFTKNVLFVSEKVKNFYIKKLKIPEQKTRVCYNGIDDSRLKPKKTKKDMRKELGIENGAILIGAVGRLVPQKDFRNFLLAVAITKKEAPVKAVIIGDGPERANLVKLAGQLNLNSNVKFLGLRHDMPDLYNAIDLLVVPSEREGLSITILEAMSMGIPVIATDVGGNSECIIEGETGILVPTKNPEALSRAIIKMLADKTFLKSIGKNGHNLFKERFTLDKMIETHEKIYEEVL